jgi:hypothetical protein
MHHICFSHGLISFFQHTPHRLRRDLVHVLQPHHAVGQQLQRPVVVPRRRRRAGDGDQLGLVLPVDLAFVRPWRLRPTPQRCLQPADTESPPHPRHRTQRDLDRLGHLFIALPLVRLEQHPRPYQRPRQLAAATDHPPQLQPLLIVQVHDVLP